MFGFVWVWCPMGHEGVIINWYGLEMKSSRKQVDENSREQTQSTSSVDCVSIEEHLRFKPCQLCTKVGDKLLSVKPFSIFLFLSSSQPFFSKKTEIFEFRKTSIKSVWYAGTTNEMKFAIAGEVPRDRHPITKFNSIKVNKGTTDRMKLQFQGCVYNKIGWS